MSDVKLCIVCDSAVGANVFVTLAMQVIQPMVMRLQEKHAGCKLTVGMVTYTTPTTRPAIVTRRAFTQATALFPLFKTSPHSLGIGTTGSGGVIGMAVLEGLVAAMEMCDEVLEAPSRRQRTRHPSLPSHPPRPPPIFHVLLVGGSRADFARRPICNRSASLDDTTWETLPDELSKRNINLSLCLNPQIKELVALHNKLWPSPDPVWFPKPKNYTILLAGTHMANAKRQLEPAGSDTTSQIAPKRQKPESPKPASRPVPPKIELPAPTFSPPKPQPPVPQPPSLPAQPAQTPDPTPSQPAVDPSFLNTYRQLHNLMLAPNVPPAQRAKFMQAGFRVDESGALIGAAGLVLDSKGQPGVGAAVPPKTHAQAWERVRQNAIAAAARGAGTGGPAAMAHQQAMIAQMRNMVQQQHQSGQLPGGQAQSGQPQAGQLPLPGQQHASQLPPSQPDLATSNLNQASPQTHRSPSHTHVQPSSVGAEVTQIQPQQPQAGPSAVNAIAQPSSTSAMLSSFQPSGGVTAPIQQVAQPQNPQSNLPPSAQPGAAQSGVAVTPYQQPGIAATPQQGMAQTPQQSQPVSGVTATPQQVSATPHHVVATPQFTSTPQHMSVTPQNIVATPQQIGVTPPHGTPQLAHSTPQALQSTPKFTHSTPQMSQSTPQTQDQGMPIPGSGLNGHVLQQSPPSAPNPILGGTQNPGATVGALVQGSTPSSNPTSAPSGSSNVWRGQIAYLLQQRLDQEPAPLHFSVIAAGGPHQNIETHRWPTRLTATTGFKPLPPEMANQLYSSPIPFGQITIDQSHSNTDIQKWQVFQKIVTAGWCIFYEFPQDSRNPAHNPAQGSHGALFFSASQAPGRILFKAFVNQLCPAAFTRGGQPAGPKLTRNPNQNPAAAVMPAAGANPAPAMAVNMPGVAAAGIVPGTATTAGTSGAGVGVPGIIPGPGAVPGAGVGIGARPNPTPTPPNVNPAVVPGSGPAGINPALMQSIASSNGMAGMPGVNPGGVPGLGSTGMHGLNPAAVPGLNPGTAPNINPAGVPGLNPATANQAAISRAMTQVALARLGLTPAQLAAAPPAQKQAILMQVQQTILRMRAQQQQNIAAAGAGAAIGMQRPPGVAGGQPGLEHLQAYIRQQQQQQQQQRQG